MNPTGGIVIFLSFIVALTLALVPLPDWADMARPEMVSLVLIYWCLAIPERIGVGIGWIAGLMMDVAKGALLGQHALALCIVAWLTLRLYKRIRVFPLWQQAMIVMLLIFLSQMIILWIKGVIGQSPQTWTYWLPAITSALLWPWLFPLMRHVRHTYKVS